MFKDGTEKIVLYHHQDGDPETLGMTLRLLCIGGLATDGSDSAMNMIRGDFSKYIKRLSPVLRARLSGDEEAENYDDKGFEPSFGYHGDIEYLYEIEACGDSSTVLLKCTEFKNDSEWFGDLFLTVRKTENLVFATRYSGWIYSERKEEIICGKEE